MSAIHAECIDHFRATMFASYRESGAENGEPFTPKCSHEALYEVTASDGGPMDDHVSYTAMCRNTDCGEFLAVTEYRTERPMELDVLTGARRLAARKEWLRQLFEVETV